MVRPHTLLNCSRRRLGSKGELMNYPPALKLSSNWVNSTGVQIILRKQIPKYIWLWQIHPSSLLLMYLKIFFSVNRLFTKRRVGKVSVSSSTIKQTEHMTNQQFLSSGRNVIFPFTGKTSLKYFQPPKRSSSFTIHKFPNHYSKQVAQSPSHPSCPKSKSPKLSNVQVAQIVKFQVAQSPSHPKLKLPKVQVAQIAQSPSCSKSKLPKIKVGQISQSQSCPNSKLPKFPKVQVAPK